VIYCMKVDSCFLCFTLVAVLAKFVWLRQSLCKRAGVVWPFFISGKILLTENVSSNDYLSF